MKNETQQPLMKTHVQSISACVSGAWALPFFPLRTVVYVSVCMCVCMRDCETERKSKRDVFSTAVSVNELSNSSSGIT